VDKETTVIDATLSSFERDVIEASMEVPVIVDFWAPWCEPCRMLGPVLEKLEREFGGRFRLVNVNSDVNPELVASFNLKSIPYAVAFVDGNAVAQFMGAQPEAFIRAFLERLIPNPAEIEHREAREAISRGHIAIAEEHLKKAIAMNPAHAAARLDYVAILVDRGDVLRARLHFDTCPRSARQVSNYEAVLARLAATEKADALPPIEILARRIHLDDCDLEARFELAELLISRKDYGPAMHQLLEVVKRDRTFRNDVARRKMLEVFDMAAANPDLVAEYRSRLSSLLF
jgi:putative thioredoxin